MLEITFKWDGNLNTLDSRLEASIANKLVDLTHLAYEKVSANLSGKILQKVSGQLLGSLREETDLGSDVMTGTVFIEPATPKAWALEKGGERFYEIFPSKAQVLSWVDKGGDRVFRGKVNHPPSKSFRYVGEAYDEMVPIVPEEFRKAIQEALEGK